MTDNLVERFPEINPSNYDHDDACALNEWGIEAASELSRLQEALAAAEAERDRLQGEVELYATVKHSTHWKARAEAAEALLAETRKKALEEARPIIDGLLTAYIEADEDGMTEHAEPIIAARAFLRSLSNDEAPK